MEWEVTGIECDFFMRIVRDNIKLIFRFNGDNLEIMDGNKITSCIRINNNISTILLDDQQRKTYIPLYNKAPLFGMNGGIIYIFEEDIVIIMYGVGINEIGKIQCKIVSKTIKEK